jgi:uncharacterized alkaline shock family protein YloU
VRPTEDCIRIADEGGSLTVTRDVLEQLVTREVLSTPGVVHLGPARRARSPGVARLLRLLGDLFGALLAPWLRPRTGVELELGDGEIAVELELVARHGVDLAVLAETLRDRVGRAVQGTTGIEVRCLDVHVVGLRWEGDPTRRPVVDAAAEARRRFSFDTTFPARP